MSCTVRVRDMLGFSFEGVFDELGEKDSVTDLPPTVSDSEKDIDTVFVGVLRDLVFDTS